MSLDLGPSIRTALIEATAISEKLTLWKNEPSIHTRRPVPADVEYPFALVDAPAAIGDADGLTSDRPIVNCDVKVYGRQGGRVDQYRLVEQLGFAIRDLFHRKKWAISPEGYQVVDIVASGPIPGPTDDEKTVARMVGLTIRLRRTT
jgi:hypothetical protein